jgi:hypothetical protein
VEEKSLYEEKQYLGYNPLSLMRRMLLSLFCFGLYWWKINNNQKGDLFFWLGMGIIGISIILLFILHMKINVYQRSIVLDGLWTTRKVKIDLSNIVKVERAKYSKYHLNNPAFNLHYKGTIRFYAGGNEAIELTDRDGLMYRIGTQRPNELEWMLTKLVKENSQV